MLSGACLVHVCHGGRCTIDWLVREGGRGRAGAGPVIGGTIRPFSFPAAINGTADGGQTRTDPHRADPPPPPNGPSPNGPSASTERTLRIHRTDLPPPPNGPSASTERTLRLHRTDPPPPPNGPSASTNGRTLYLHRTDPLPPPNGPSASTERTLRLRQTDPPPNRPSAGPTLRLYRTGLMLLPNHLTILGD